MVGEVEVGEEKFVYVVGEVEDVVLVVWCGGGGFVLGFEGV